MRLKIFLCYWRGALVSPSLAKSKLYLLIMADQMTHKMYYQRYSKIIQDVVASEWKSTGDMGLEYSRD